MRTLLPFIRQRARMAVNGPRATPIVLRWVVMAGDATVDPTTGAKLGTATPQTETVRALVHFPDTATMQVRQFQEIEEGDAIVDFQAEVVLDGREQLTFEFGGQTWVQKKTGEKLAKSWDAEHNGQRIFRTVLLRKAT